jgi:hypothetical protein
VPGEVNPSSIKSKRYIDTVVDQQRHPIRRQALLEACPECVQLTRTEILLAQLDRASATPCRGDHHLFQSAPGCLLPICDHIQAKV